MIADVQTIDIMLLQNS